MMHLTRRAGLAALLFGATLIGGCAGEGKREGGESHDEAAEHRGDAAKSTGRVILVEAHSDEKGNYFKPADFEAHRGDVIRFVLKSGVHNVNFLPDSNAGKSGLPPASDMLQLPDQAYDVPVTLAEGRYYFQCDPHVALGMKGHVKVED